MLSIFHDEQAEQNCLGHLVAIRNGQMSTEIYLELKDCHKIPLPLSKYICLLACSTEQCLFGKISQVGQSSSSGVIQNSKNIIYHHFLTTETRTFCSTNNFEDRFLRGYISYRIFRWYLSCRIYVSANKSTNRFIALELCELSFQQFTVCPNHSWFWT